MPAKAGVALVGFAVLIAGCAPAQPGPAATTIVSAKPTAGAFASPSASVAIAIAKPVVSPVASPGASPAASPGVAASPSPVVLATRRPAPQPVVAGTFGFGRPATADEVKKIDIDVRPDGVGLPAGSGTAAQGRQVFAQKCAVCHGASGEGTVTGPRLIDATPFKTGVTPATVGNYWPYATTVFDYINRAMPFDKPGSLTADEVYALTAFLLSENKVIAEADAMTAQSLPGVKMPNAAGFTSPDPRPDAP
jgi:mono/diheme cytochrome c family protein